MTSYAGCIVCLTVCLIYMVAVGRSGAKNFFVRHFNDYFLILFCKIILKSWIFSSYCLSVTAGYRINPLPLSLILNAPPGCIPYSVIIWENIESFYRVYLGWAGLFLRKETTWYETKQIAMANLQYSATIPNLLLFWSLRNDISEGIWFQKRNKFFTWVFNPLYDRGRG